MKFQWTKGGLTALITGIAVVGVCAAALKNADLSVGIFNPANFEKLENKRTPDGYDYMAGDGEEMELADENADSDKSSGTGDQQVLKTDTGMPEQEPGPSDSTGGNEIRQASGQGENRSGYEITEDENTGRGGVTINTGDGGTSDTGNAGGGSGTDGGNGANNGQIGKDDANGTTDPTPAPAPTPSPSPEPSEPDRTPTAWEESQLKPRDPEETAYGTLKKLTAVQTAKQEGSEEPKYYCIGDAFDPDDFEVTGLFQKEDGTQEKQTLEYQTDYQVSFSTTRTGTQTAVFRYGGLTARVSYYVLMSGVEPQYHAQAPDDTTKIYGALFPGTPFDTIDETGTVTETLKALKESVKKAVSGNVFDLTGIHSRMIAYLGDAEIQKAFAGTEGGSYNRVVFLQEKDGYLTTMLTGFAAISGQVIVEDGEKTYVYYPAKDWGAVSKNLVNIVKEVPEGFKIRRIVGGKDDLTEYQGDQVLEQYTGTESTLTVPMGVTEIRLTAGNTTVEKLILPQSVVKIDLASIRTYLPGLKEYSWADGEGTTTGAYSVKDGILYADGGKTLVSVPANYAEKEITVPATVTKLAENCFAGLASDYVIHFKGERAPIIEGKTGFQGTMIVPDFQWNTVAKSYLFAFGEENLTWKTEDGTEIPYGYQTEGPVLTEQKASDTLIGIPQNVRGKYTLNASLIRKIGPGAFMGCTGLSEIELGSSVKTLKKDSLVLPENVEAVTLSGPGIAVSGAIFGDPKTTDLPAIAIYVREEDYEEYLTSWSEVLDPIYGEGTAETYLVPTSGTFLYQDGVKYLESEKDGVTTYRVVRVYEEGRTALRLLEGTTGIQAGAFLGCTELEILLLPESLTELDGDVLTDCGALETVLCENPDIEIHNGKARSGRSLENAEIYKAGGTFESFLYEDGVIYGREADESLTLLNVPTDYSDTVSIKENTKILYEKAFYGCSVVPEIKIPDLTLLEEIGDDCFEGMTVLEKLDLSASTKLRSIGAEAFSMCTGLSELTLPEGLESLGERAFYNCSRLKTVQLPESLTTMEEGCFENCTSLTSVALNGQLEGISRYSFYGCRWLSNISFGEKQKGALKIIGAEAFAQCWNLEEMDLRELTALEWLGERAFEGCEELTVVKLPTLVWSIPDYCFSDCKILSIVELDADRVAKLGEKPFGDTVSKYLNLWVKEEVYEKAYAAYQSILDTDSILGVINENAEIIKGVEYELTGEGRVLKKVANGFEGALSVPEDTIRIEAGAFENCTTLTSVGLPLGSSIELGDRCFAGCTELKEVLLYGQIPEWGEETFMDCTALEKVNIGNGAEKTPIPRIGTRAFKNCTGLKASAAISIYTPVEILGEECFAGCSSMTTIGVLTSTRSSLQEIEDSAFEGCTKLTAYLTSAYTGLKRIGTYAFRNCDTLKQPSVPVNVESIGEGCFMDCDNLMYVSFYGGKIEEYPKDCFKNCPKLIRTGGLPAAFQGLKRIGESAYEGCISLTNSTSWNLGKYTSLEEIGDYAFRGCISLTDATLSETVTKLGEGVFEGCTGLIPKETEDEAAVEAAQNPESGEAVEIGEPTENENAAEQPEQENTPNTEDTEEDGEAGKPETAGTDETGAGEAEEPEQSETEDSEESEPESSGDSTEAAEGVDSAEETKEEEAQR